MELQIIYASTSGNVELVCENIAATIYNQFNISSRLHRAEVTDIETILDNQYFILATSTWEHGELNPFFAKLHTQMQRQSLQGKFAGVVGLGDIRYEPVLFCQGAHILADTFADRGGKLVGDILKINGEPHHQLELVTGWCGEFVTELKSIAHV